MIVLNYGGGTNSTALAIECARREIKISLAVFADTGSERPETYEYLERFDRWMMKHHGIGIDRVRWIRRDGTFTPLHEDCESKKTLPSKAFGLAGCTVKWKQQPVDKWLSEHAKIRAHWFGGGRVIRLIGYDADEPSRADRMLEKNPDPDKWQWRAPLVEWNMGRDECVETIRAAGLTLPGKSACWMCPSSKPREVLALGREHPDLLARALKMEATAELGSVKGLGRSWSWASVVEADRRQVRLPMFDATDPPVDIACGCYDGEAA